MTGIFGMNLEPALTTPASGIMQTPMNKNDDDTSETIKRLEAWGELFYGRNVTRNARATLTEKISVLWRRLVRKSDET
jgi:hypothetical protein